ncbi:MAG TPA: transcription elongation factor GreA [Anaerolineae bacterium]
MFDKPVYVTAAGLAQLKADLEHLRNVERPEIIERLQTAQEDGDWMDNTEVMLIREDLAFVEARIDELERMLANVQLIEASPDDSVIDIGDTAVIQANGNALETYTIVGVAEADPARGLISNESPLGHALLNHKVGDEVIVKVPDGVLRFRVVAVK